MGLREHQLGIAVAVADVDRARSFYEDRVGLEVKDSRDGEMVRYECGTGSSLTVYLSPEHAGKATGTLGGWEVEDLEAEMSELESRGVEFERYDLETIKTDERGIFVANGSRIAWFRDPEGNTFAISE